MGNDGGVIAVQRKFLRGVSRVTGSEKAAAEEMKKREKAEIRTRVCSISNELLKEPIIACDIGYLYNKDVLLQCLLDKSLNAAFAHIRGLKDVVDCKFTPNPSFHESDISLTDGRDFEQLPAKYICPVTMVEMNSRSPFVVIKSTGWVLSEKAIKEVGMENLQGEYGPFTQDDIIKLVPDDDEVEEIRAKLFEKRECEKAAKKLEKKKRRREDENNGVLVNDEANKKEKKEKHNLHKSNHNAHNKDLGTSIVSSTATRLAGAARKAVEESKKQSSVFKSMFREGRSQYDIDEEKKGTKGNKLFIATGGSRYTLG